MEGTESRVPSSEHPGDLAGPVRAPSAPPARRRRSAIVGAAALVAVSPVAVAAGMFVPGFAALGVGALLLLLPPRARREGERRSPRRIVGAPLVAAGRGILTSARGTAVGARGANAAAARTWAVAGDAASSGAQGLVVAARRLVDDGRAASSATWSRIGPMLGRAWAAGVAGSVRGGHELDALARTASERLSAVIDANQPFVRPVARPPHRAPRRGPREPIPRAPRPRHRRGPRGAR